MADITARGMAARAMTSGGGGGGGTTVDAYNKTETDSLLRGKANVSDVYTSQQTDDLLDDKVDKVNGKGLSTNDYTNEDMSLVKTISNKANITEVDENINNLQRQINTVNETLTDFETEITTKIGYSLGMSIDASTYVMTMTLKNSKGSVVSTQSIDLPIESMVIDASYANGKLNLTLQNGTLLSVDISSIVSGLVKDTFKIAGIDMKDNIEASELRSALGIYTKTEVDNLLDKKANSSTTYSKTEVDGKVSTINTNIQANVTAINATNERVTQNESDILNLDNNKLNLNFGYAYAPGGSSPGWYKIARCEFNVPSNGEIRDATLYLEKVQVKNNTTTEYECLIKINIVANTNIFHAVKARALINNDVPFNEIKIVAKVENGIATVEMWGYLETAYSAWRATLINNTNRANSVNFGTAQYWELLKNREAGTVPNWATVEIVDCYGTIIKDLSDRITALENK